MVVFAAGVTVGVMLGGPVAIGTIINTGTVIVGGGGTAATGGTAAIGTVAAATGSAAAGTATAGSTVGAAATTFGIVSGPAGWITLGATESDDGNHVTYDCWKPVIHDVSEAPSDGMLLKDVVCHPNVADVTIAPGFCDQLPHIVLKNVWDEEFEVEYLAMPDTGKIVCHAKAINV